MSDQQPKPSRPSELFGEYDELLVTGYVTSCRGRPFVRDMPVTAATVYSRHDAEDPMAFKVWCDPDDPQLPPDGDTRLWFDWSDPETHVVVVRRDEP